jgi:hypothetical protein
MDEHNSATAGGLTLTSGTQTAEALGHAVSESWREPFIPKGSAGAEEKIEREVETAEAEHAETADAETAEQTESERPKRMGGFQRRISKLTKRNYELQEKLRRYEGGDGNAQQQETAPPSAQVEEQAPTAQPDRRPSDARTRYADFDEVIDAADRIAISGETEKAIRGSSNSTEVAYFLAKHPELIRSLEADGPARAKERVQQISRELEQFHALPPHEQAEILRKRGLFEAHTARVQEALNAERDAKQLFDAAQGKPVAPFVAQGILEQDNSHAIAIHLARNPKVLEELNRLPAAAAISKIGRIAERLDSESSNGSGATRRPKTKLPEPINPVGGSSARTSLPMDQLPQAEYNRAREQQIRERRRYGGI